MLTAICSAINGKDVDGCGNDVLSIVVLDCVKLIDEGSGKPQLVDVYELPECPKINAMPLLGFIVIYVYGELPATTEKV